jgi:DNA-binding CsgD family transcriptional regulator
MNGTEHRLRCCATVSSVGSHESVSQGGRGGLASPTVIAAAEQLAVASLRIGMGLMVAAATTDWLFAAIAGAGLTTMLEGAALTAVAVAGVIRPDAVRHLLGPGARVLVPALAFAAVGAIDFGLQTYYGEVAPAIVWIAVIISAPRWIVLCVIVSAAGYVADLALQGHSTNWMINGPGQNLVANQVVDLVANAGVVWLLVYVLRAFIATAPSSVLAVRHGGPSLTPQLALAAAAPAPMLHRADPVAVTAGLTRAERRVLAALATGRTPKQVAWDQSVALPTVRTHIASAKRKTGARTIEQLVALFAESSIDA